MNGLRGSLASSSPGTGENVESVSIAVGGWGGVEGPALLRSITSKSDC